MRILLIATNAALKIYESLERSTCTHRIGLHCRPLGL